LLIFPVVGYSNLIVLECPEILRDPELLYFKSRDRNTSGSRFFHWYYRDKKIKPQRQKDSKFNRGLSGLSGLFFLVISKIRG